MRRQAYRRIHALTAFGIAVTLVGCTAVPSGRFAAFADGTRSLATNSVTTYDGVVDLERTYMLYSPTTSRDGKLDEQSFKPVIVDEDGRKRDFDFKPRLEFRSAALDVLADYADALHAFATKDYQSDLDEATQSLGASVARVASEASGQDATKAAGILATAINGMGRVATEYLRRKTLRQAMDTAQPGVDKLAALIATDNASIVGAVHIMRRGIVRHANKLRPSTGLSRVSFDAAIAALLQESDDTLAELDAMNATVTAVPAAHADIRRSLDEKMDALASLQQLIAEAKRLNKFHKSTNKADKGS